jgi:hypothetical protein
MAMHYNPTKPFNINDVEIREDGTNIQEGRNNIFSEPQKSIFDR